MHSIDDIIVTKTTLLKEALKIIDTGSKQICLVLDENKKLLGTINDGDVRRALLNNLSLDDSIIEVYFDNPTVVNVNDSKETILNICKLKKIHQVPVVDDDNVVVGLEIIDELIGSSVKKNKVILMVGGLGSRLRPLTDSMPKPMLPVGGKPILQTIVEKLVNYGFINIVMCTGYKSDVIKDFFEEGSKFGAVIEYVQEDKKLGTCGALSLLVGEKRPEEAFLVMNGDLLTNINFEHLLQFHCTSFLKATMCVRNYEFQIPFGVVDIENGKVKDINEKPTYKFFVSAGIYVFDSSIIDLIPRDEFYDMPMLFKKLMQMNKHIASFPLREYWLDIGRIEEFEKANKEYSEVF